MSGANDVNILYDPVRKMACPFCHGQLDTSGTPAFTSLECPSCGHTMVVPARLGAFLLLDLLGKGGMGGVFRAHDESLGRDVAIKVMLKSLGDNPEFLQNFRREAQAAAKLNHPHIAQIYAFGSEKGQPYIVMELVGGKHFDQMIASGEPLDPVLVMRIGADIADGLKLAADAGLVHGDIKPENILLDERGEAKLLDFGLASSINQSSNEIWGTPYYIAPEKVRRQRTDHRSDIYCLGGTLYHALAGRPPFDGEDAVAVVKARFAGPPEPLTQIRPDIPKEVADIVERMLQLEPGRRYPTYDSLLGDMRRYLSSASPAAPTGGRKMVMIKGKRPAAGAAASASSSGGIPASASPSGPLQPASPSQAPAAGGGHGKIMISRGASRAAPSASPAPSDTQDGAEGDTPPAEEKNYTLVIVMSVFFSVLGLLVVGGGVTAWMIHRKHVREQQEQAAAEAEFQKARAALQAQYKRFSAARDKVQAAAEEAKMVSSEAEQAAIEELAASEGGDVAAAWQGRVAPPPPPEPEPEPAEPEAGEGGEAPEGAEEPAADASDAADADDAAGADAASGADDDAGADDASGDDSGDDAAAEEPAEEEAAPELVLMARAVFEAGRPVEEAARLAAREPDLPAVNDAAGIAGQAAMLGNRADELERAAGSCASAIAKMRGKLADLQARIQAAREERERLAAAAEKERQEALEQERAEKAARDARKKIDDECEAVRGQVAGQMGEIAKYSFKTPIRILKNYGERLESDEAKALLQREIDRIRYLSDFKDFLVKKLAEGDFQAGPGGWTVTAADERGITLNGKATLRWSDPKLDASRLVPMINFYLRDEHRLRGLQLRELRDASYGAAVYCLVFGVQLSPDGARKLAQDLVDGVIRKNPNYREDAARLFPELTFE